MRTTNIKRFIGVIVATLLLAGCANDELTPSAVQILPEGMYPLQIAAVSISAESTAEPWGTSSPQTRVSENPTDGKNSLWDGGEEITVQLSGKLADGTTSYRAERNYKLNDDKTSLTSVSGKELYWHSTSVGTVTAWYSNYTSDNIVDLSDQSNGLAYVLSTVQNASFNTPLSLSFTHKLAKIRVTLVGTADMEGGTVKVKGYTKGTITNGNVEGSDAGWITMQRISYSDGTTGYEANVIPGRLALYKSAFQVTSKNGAPVPVDLDASVSVTGGQIHKITLTVNKAG